MNIVKFFISFIAAWFVRWATVKMSELFGATITPAEQKDLENWIVGAAFVACAGIIEALEKLVWPRVKPRLLSWWDRVFPPAPPPKKGAKK